MSPARKELLLTTVVGVLIACAIFATFLLVVPTVVGRYSLDADGFVSTIEHGGEVSLDGLTIIDNSTLGQKKIRVTEDMITSISDTDTAGRKEIVIKYEGKEYVIQFDVKYRVSYASYGDVIDSQLVVTADDLVEPAEPKPRTGYKFAGWDYDFSQGLTESIQVNAIFVEIDYPSLEGITATYGDTLGDITLPSNEYGHWEFVSDVTTPVGNAGKEEHSVRFAYNGDDTVYKYDFVNITVQKKRVELGDLVDSFVYDGEEHFPTFTIPEGLTVVTTGSANTKAGEYSYTVEIIDPNHEGLYIGTYNITKPTVTVTVSSATVTYPASVPEFTYTVEGFDDVELLGIEIDAPAFASQTGVFEIGITYTNDNVNYDIHKGVFTVLKGDVEVEKPDVTEATYEDRLSSIEFVGKFTGTWSWENPDAVIDNINRYVAYAIFTPDNPNYNTVRMVIEITGIRKKNLTFNVTGNTFEYSPDGGHALEYEIVGGIYPDLYKTLRVTGNTAESEIGTYRRTLTIVDDRYTGSVITDLVITKATPAVDFTTVYERDWDEELRLETIQLPAGYTWVNPRERISASGESKFKAIFTPDDKEHYRVVEGEFTIRVAKIGVTVAGILDSYVKDYDTYKFDIKNSGIAAYYTDGELTITYYKDGEEVDEIVNAGDYEVVITVAEGTNYLGITEKRDVKVNRVENTQDVDIDQTVYYLDDISELDLPDDVEGKWSWLETDFGEVGTTIFTAVYTPDENANYYPREEKVTVKVDPRPVILPEYDITLDYNGKGQTLGLTSTGVYEVKDLGGTNVGSYTAVITIYDTKNFTWGNGSADFTIDYEIVPSDNSWVYLPANNLTFPFDTSLEALLATAQYGGVRIEYKLSTDPDSEYSTTVPKDVEVYNVRYTTLDENCTEILTEVRTFAITPIEVVPTPYIVNKLLTYNSEKQYATLADLVEGIYDISDTGATNVADTGVVTLTITDLNYVWADGTRVLTLTYGIAKADNDWDVQPSISESIYYDEDFVINGSADYDDTVTYYREAGSDDEFVLGLPENAGDYEIMFTTNSVNAYSPEAKYFTVHIEKATVTGITFPDGGGTYNGNPHYIYISGTLPEGVTVTYENNGQINFGTYTVTAKFTVSDNYYPIEDMTATLDIIKSSITGITFPNGTVVYDGDPHSIFISGELPKDVEVEYVNNGQTEPGTYIITAKFKTTGNYESLPDMTATLFIDKITFDMSDVTFSDKNVTYTGDPHSIFISGTLPEGVTVTYENNGQTNFGTYTVTAKFSCDTEYHHPIADKTATLSIGKATVTGITFPDGSATYDGDPHSIFISGTLPEGVTVTYENNGQTNFGTYTVTAKFTVNDNFYPVDDMTATLSIGKATVTGITFPDGAATYNGDPHSIFISGTLPEGVTVTYKNNGQTNFGTYTVTAKFTVNDNFYPVDDMTATLSIGKATVTGITFPDGAATYNGNPHYIYISGTLPEGVTVTYENNGQTNFGTYTVTAKFTVNDNFYPVDDMTATLSIGKATVTGLSMSNATLEYNGSKQVIPVSGTIPNGVTVTYEGGGTTVGSYTVTAKFTVNDNYYPIADMSATLTIKVAVVTLGDISISDIFYTKTPSPVVALDKEFARSSIKYSYSTNGVDFGDISLLYNTKGYIPEGNYWVKAYVDSANTNITPASSAAKQFKVNKATPNRLVVELDISSSLMSNGYYYQNTLPGTHKASTIKVYYDGVEVEFTSAVYEGITFGGDNSTYNMKITPADADNFNVAVVGCEIKIKTVATIGHGGNVPGTTSFGTIEDAVRVANSMDSAVIWIVPDKTGNVRINENIVLESGVTLRLPYGENSTDYNTDYVATLAKGATNLGDGVDYPAENDSATFLACRVILSAGKSITVNSGAVLDIAGQLSGGGYCDTYYNYAGHTAGLYAVLELEASSEIFVSGTVNALGYIREASENNQSKVHVNVGGALYQPFVLRDFRTGNYMSAAAELKYVVMKTWEHGFAPFTRFMLMNVSPEIHTVSGGYIYGCCNLYAGGAMNDIKAAVVGNSQSDMIQIGEKLVSKYDVSTEIMHLHFYGGARLNAMTLDGGGVVGTVSSTDFVFALTYHNDIILDTFENGSAATYYMGQRYKMLPGAKIIVKPNVTLDVNFLNIYKEGDSFALGDNLFYETILKTTASGVQGYILAYPHGHGDAQLILEGNATLVAASIGGDVIATGDGAKVSVSTAVSVSSYEITDFTEATTGGTVNQYETITGNLVLRYGNELSGIVVGREYESKDGVWVLVEKISFTVPNDYDIEWTDENGVLQSTVGKTGDDRTIILVANSVVTIIADPDLLYFGSAVTEGEFTFNSLAELNNHFGGTYSWTVSASARPVVYKVPLFDITGLDDMSSYSITYKDLNTGAATVVIKATMSGKIGQGGSTSLTVNGISGYTFSYTGKEGSTVGNTYTISGTDKSGVEVSITATIELSADYATTIELTGTFTAGTISCVTPDTLITLADGSQVRVDSLTGDEMLLVWNLETGRFDYAPIMFVDSEELAEFEVIYLHFSDGSVVKVISEHGFWDYNLNKYVYLDANSDEYIGHSFAKQSGDELVAVQLIGIEVRVELTTAWSPVTVGHLCYFVNGMLSMPGGVGGLFNIFEVDSDTMTYDYDAIARDIETYGLFTYEELNAICPLSEAMFEAAGGAYLKISIGKGNLTMDELIFMIERYSVFFE